MCFEYRPRVKNVKTTVTKPATAPEKTLGGFKIGDRVQVTASRFADDASKYSGPATVTGYDSGVYVIIKTDSGVTGYFYPKNLEPVSTATPKTSVTNSKSAVYQTAVNAAIKLGRKIGTVNADLVQAELEKIGYTSSDLGNAAGNIFRSKNFKKIGSIKSAREGNHSREISNYQYIGA